MPASSGVEGLKTQVSIAGRGRTSGAASSAVERRVTLRTHAPPALNRGSAPWAGSGSGFGRRDCLRWPGGAMAFSDRAALQPCDDRAETDARQGEPPLRRAATRIGERLQDVERHRDSAN